MRTDGFKRTRVGYTWPTTDIKKIENQLRFIKLEALNKVKK